MHISNTIFHSNKGGVPQIPLQVLQHSFSLHSLIDDPLGYVQQEHPSMLELKYNDFIAAITKQNAPVS